MNLFRSLPKPLPAPSDPDEEPEPFMDPQWAHLVIVYELLLQLVGHPLMVACERVFSSRFKRCVPCD